MFDLDTLSQDLTILKPNKNFETYCKIMRICVAVYIYNEDTEEKHSHEKVQMIKKMSLKSQGLTKTSIQC